MSIIESLSYLFVPMLSWQFFKETITWRKADAAAVIMVGVMAFLFSLGNGRWIVPAIGHCQSKIRWC